MAACHACAPSKCTTEPCLARARMLDRKTSSVFSGGGRERGGKRTSSPKATKILPDPRSRKPRTRMYSK
eukprot:11178618-Alexandrium_andersonii.AAC.1